MITKQLQVLVIKWCDVQRYVIQMRYWLLLTGLNAHLQLVVPLQHNKPYSFYENGNELLLWRLAIPIMFKSNITPRCSRNSILQIRIKKKKTNFFYCVTLHVLFSILLFLSMEKGRESSLMNILLYIRTSIMEIVSLGTSRPFKEVGLVTVQLCAAFLWEFWREAVNLKLKNLKLGCQVNMIVFFVCANWKQLGAELFFLISVIFIVLQKREGLGQLKFLKESMQQKQNLNFP